MALVPQLTRRRDTGGGNPNHNLVVDRKDDLRLFPSRWAKVGLLLLLFLYWYLPTHYLDASGVRTWAFIGTFAIGAIGLNLLSGFTGQISLGHAFFIGVGSYTIGYLGVTLEDPYPLWQCLIAAAVIAFAVGAAIGPFALRLRGVYLAIVTIGLIFVGRHLFNNWDSVTGGSRGITRFRGNVDMSMGPIDLAELSFLGTDYSEAAGLFFLIWALVAVGALLAKNIVRTRPGRAMQAVRDRDLSAEVIGVNLARTKVAAFAISSAYAGVAGVLHAVLVGSARATDFGLIESINFIAIIIIGGIGTIFGAILGAIFVVGGETLIDNNSSNFVFDWLVPDYFTVGELTGILFGLIIVLFLLFEPRGLAALWLRFKTWLVSWPFKY